MQGQGIAKTLFQVCEPKGSAQRSTGDATGVLRFPLSTAGEADLAVHTATNSDTALASGNRARPLGNSPGAGELRPIVGCVPQACQFSAVCVSEPLSFHFGLKHATHSFSTVLRWPIMLSAMRGLPPEGDISLKSALG
jgi:hypothetical protein